MSPIQSQQYGGKWTQEKLDILREYLNAYTTALKNQPFTLWYIDAFAGTGDVAIRDSQDSEAQAMLQGSARIACEINDKPFDKLVFIEDDSAKADLLRAIEPTSDRIIVRHGDANEELQRICHPKFRSFWQPNRAVLFLDPFALEVEWSTVEDVAQTKAMDTWILFPSSAVRRMLPRERRPDDIDPKWVSKLTKVFGDESWREIYSMASQQSLFGEINWVSDSGTEKIVELYKEKLATIFAGIAPTSRTLRNDQNSPLFEFIFAVGNKRGKAPAIRIANHILRHL